MSEMSTDVGWSYQAGPWFAVFGPQVTVLLPESERERVIRIWATVDAGGGFDEVLDGLLASGLSSLPGFVLLGAGTGPTRVLLRGSDVSVTLATGDDELVLDGSASATWVEQSVEGVTGLRIDIAESGDDVHFPIHNGLVRVGRVDRPAVASGAAGAAEPELGAPEVAASVEPVAEEPVAREQLVEAPVAEPPVAEPPVAEPPVAEAPVAEAPVEDLPTEMMPVVDADLVEAAAAEEPAPEPTPADEAGEGSELEMPLSGDPLTDPFPPEAPPVGEAPEVPEAPAVPEVPQAPETSEESAPEEPATPAPEGWVTPWDQPAPEAPATEAPDAEAPEVALPVSEAPPFPAPLAPPGVPEPPAGPEPVTEVASSYPPPPPVSAPAPPPLGIGSWEPIGGFPPPPPPADTDHDGLTNAGADQGQPPPPPGIPGQPPAPPVTQPVARLMISDGQDVVVDRVVLIGRAPEARRFTSTEQPLLVTVPSRLHEISSTHVEVRPGTGADHGTAVVTDMGSTNGTVLVQPGLGPEDLKPGIAVQLIPGAIINLGDGITIQVTRP
ncbi:MAG TPA: hypothetical protein VNS55_16105 [Nocardioides sp.]|nr:hypothetical protein [Nocardioides sp.]